MREILFRGKRIDSELWVEGSLVNNIFFRAGTNCPVPYIINPDEYAEYDCMEDIGELAVEVISETVSQFTGLTAKGGKEIYEDDIVEFKNIDRQYVKGIVYYLGSCFLIQSIIADEDDYNLGGVFSVTKGLIRVIGNIHDNPELVEAGE